MWRHVAGPNTMLSLDVNCATGTQYGVALQFGETTDALPEVYYEGQQVIVGDAPDVYMGKSFDGWVATPAVTITRDKDNGTSEFLMPASDVLLTATYKDNPSHKLLVNGVDTGKTYREGEYIDLYDLLDDYKKPGETIVSATVDGKEVQVPIMGDKDMNLVLTYVKMPTGEDLQKLVEIFLNCAKDAAHSKGPYPMTTEYNLYETGLPGELMVYLPVDPYVAKLNEEHPGHLPQGSEALNVRLCYENGAWKIAAGNMVPVTCNQTATYTVTFINNNLLAEAEAKLQNMPQNLTGKKYGEKITFTLPTSTGWVVEGWGSQQARDINMLTNSFTMPAGDVVIELYWAMDKSGDGVPDYREAPLTITASWDDEKSPVRPTSQTIHIYREDVLLESVVLTKASNWTYTRKVDNLYKYSVKADAPQYYTTTVTQKQTGGDQTYGYDFTKLDVTITNTKVKTPVSSGKVLQTGQLNQPVAILSVAGVSAIAMGLFLVMEKRKGRYEK